MQSGIVESGLSVEPWGRSPVLEGGAAGATRHSQRADATPVVAAKAAAPANKQVQFLEHLGTVVASSLLYFSQSVENNGLAAVRWAGSRGRTLRVPVTLDGVPLESVLDTGAVQSCISARTAKQLGGDDLFSDAQFITLKFANNVVAQQRLTRPLEVVFTGSDGTTVTATTRLAEVPDGPFPILLGTDVCGGALIATTRMDGATFVCELQGREADGSAVGPSIQVAGTTASRGGQQAATYMVVTPSAEAISEGEAAGEAEPTATLDPGQTARDLMRAIRAHLDPTWVPASEAAGGPLTATEGVPQAPSAFESGITEAPQPADSLMSEAIEGPGTAPSFGATSPVGGVLAAIPRFVDIVCRIICPNDTIRHVTAMAYLSPESEETLAISPDVARALGLSVEVESEAHFAGFQQGLDGELNDLYLCEPPVIVLCKPILQYPGYAENRLAPLVPVVRYDLPYPVLLGGPTWTTPAGRQWWVPASTEEPRGRYYSHEWDDAGEGPPRSGLHTYRFARQGPSVAAQGAVVHTESGRSRSRTAWRPRGRVEPPYAPERDRGYHRGFTVEAYLHPRLNRFASGITSWHGSVDIEWQAETHFISEWLAQRIGMPRPPSEEMAGLIGRVFPMPFVRALQPAEGAAGAADFMFQPLCGPRTANAPRK